jgi:pimeloyl-ACP methyl ester carboxylesterase
VRQMSKEPGEGSRQTEESFPVRFATIHGHRIGYRRGGDGPLLLLLHGIAGSSRTWIPAMELLQAEYTVVAPDFVGHGHSAKPAGDYSLGNFANWMRDLLVVLGIERATVIGQSFGGGVAMQFAYQFPDRCERLVLVDAGGLGREVNPILRLVTLPGAEYVMPVLFPSFARRWGDSVAHLADRVGLRSVPAMEIWRSYRSLTDSEGRQAFVRTMRSVIEPGGQSVSALDRLYLAERTPTLIVWGEKDRIIPLAHAYQALEAAPHCRLEILPGVGHFPQSEDPAGFVEVLTDFLRTTEPSAFAAEEQRDRLQRGSGDPQVVMGSEAWPPSAPMGPAVP